MFSVVSLRYFFCLNVRSLKTSKFSNFEKHPLILKQLYPNRHYPYSGIETSSTFSRTICEKVFSDFVQIKVSSLNNSLLYHSQNFVKFPFISSSCANLAANREMRFFPVSDEVSSETEMDREN